MPDPVFLHGLVRKEARCLLQYVSESSPWSANATKLRGILVMAHREGDLLANLIRYCVKKKLGNPGLGAYPHSFMGINFASLDYLLPMLIDDEKTRIADWEWAKLSLPADAVATVEALIHAKKSHLGHLQEMLVGG